MGTLPRNAPADGENGSLSSLKISAKIDCGRGVPGALRRNHNFSIFSPQPVNSAAYPGGNTEDFPQNGIYWRLTGQNSR
jgi:hypothetical protein